MQVQFEIKIDDSKSLVIPDPAMAEEIYSLINADREHLRIWLPWVDQTHSHADTRENLEARIAGFADKTQASFYGTYNGNIVASVGFISLSDGVGEIGYWLLSHYQGQGLMTAFVRACIDYGFTELGLKQIVIKCAEGNDKSAFIPKRLGFTQSAEKGPARDRGGDVRETLIFTMNAENWSQ